MIRAHAATVAWRRHLARGAAQNITGYEVARRVRARYARQGERGPLLIAVTCYQQASDKILAQLCGFDHHIGKPFDTRALLKMLARGDEK